MPKKSNIKRADGRYCVQVFIGRDENGKRKYKTVYGNTQKEANAKADNIKTQLGKGIDISKSNNSFSNWASSWLQTKQQTVGNGQYIVYSSCVKHLNLYIGSMEISKIQAIDIQNVINQIFKVNPNTDKPGSKRMLQEIQSTARQIFILAIKNRVLDYNPADYVEIPKSSNKDDRRALTDEEQQWILDTPHRARTAAMIMMYAGLRRGELIPLTWNDIDLENSTITVNKTVEMIKGKPLLKNGAKTQSGSRVIDIPHRLVDYLLQEKVKSKTLLVVTNTKGQMYSSSGWRALWKSYLIELNIKYGNSNKRRSKYDPHGSLITIPNITAHWLRHTFASLLYMSGVDVLTAKEQLGHSDIKTTLQVYTHLDKIYKRNSMCKLDDYLDNKTRCKSDASQNIL